MSNDTDDFTTELKRARATQPSKHYSDHESEKIRQKAARIFERYEQEMYQKISEQQKDHFNEHSLYS